MRSSDASTLVMALLGLYAINKVVGIVDPPDGRDPGENPYPDPGGAPSQWSLAQLRGYADSLEAAFWPALGAWENEATVISILASIPTDRDAVNLVNVYGKRGSYLQSFTLPFSVRRWLAPSNIAAINAALSTRGVSFRF